MDVNFENKSWWNYMEHDLQELIVESFFLLDQAKDIIVHDYSFVVFPAAKAYEGFLKKMLFDLQFITEEDFTGKHFRIGKALNPSLPAKFRKEGVYDKIADYCGGKDLADYLWDTWRLSRNLVFHWFPQEKNALTLPEARERLDMIVTAFDRAFAECKIS